MEDGGPQSSMTGALQKGEIWRQTHTRRDCLVKTGAEEHHQLPQAKGRQRQLANHEKLEERRGTDPLSQLSAGPNSPNTLILDFWSPELRDSKILLFKPLSLLYFVMTAPEN